MYSSEAPISLIEIEQQQSKLIRNNFGKDFIQCFCESIDIFERIRISSKSLSSEQKILKEQNVAQHLAKMNRDYESGLDEFPVENMDETHFIFDMFNGKRLGC